MKKLSAIIIGVSLVSCTIANQAELTVSDKLQQAMQSDIRSEAEVKRDANRLPIETLEFFGFKDDMRVIELIPGTGWYSKLLAPTLADKGKLYVSMFTKRFEKNLAAKKAFSKVTVLPIKGEYSNDEDTGLYSVTPFIFDVEPVDMVLTFRNYHNFDEQGRRNINKAAFAALKSGGLYGVIDHTRRHNVVLSPDVRRRIDPVLAIKEIQDAGFVMVDYSDLHYRPQDGLDLEVGDKSVTGQTDRWTILFKKP